MKQNYIGILELAATLALVFALVGGAILATYEIHIKHLYTLSTATVEQGTDAPVPTIYLPWETV